MWKVYFNKKMGGRIRPGSSWASTFSGDQEEAKIPSIEQQDSRMGHLDVLGGFMKIPLKEVPEGERIREG